MKNQVEKARISLSSQQNSSIDLFSVARNTNYQYIISRDEFVSICDDQFKIFILFVLRMLKCADLSTSSLDMNQLAGGLSHIPHIYELMKQI